MNKPAGSAMSYDELRGAIAQKHHALSGRLQQIAEFVLDHPTDVALGTVARPSPSASISQQNNVFTFRRRHHGIE